MSFESEEAAIRFTIEMALLSVKFAPKPERNEHVRIAQTDAILVALRRSGYDVVKVREEPHQGEMRR
ncbi:hypothetical protein Rvan_1485 [Rhodomicrobium vannielii ATCC 17100]|uniref:Uncharacterized protein n=1 Tax=Rhodomicrobium vannielii (strain ATCC 17100 / DSM 162 / LMG 4299 / NCIMB 10020 / ATH 3.1.1) TaxID=648757 RepID=E3I789_RHOVT|nr:hypothetical protein [Rhodomicrobium vannielii]ADP70740.1 hypothetical protein Rvan_1485 [Rhodomicrobium vannielii ATCC 17100]